MTVHVKMFDKRKEPTMHRIYVEWEGGFFIVLGSTCEAFQSMVEDMGRPKKVEFRATDEGWHSEDCSSGEDDD